MSQRDVRQEAPSPANGGYGAAPIGYSLGIRRVGCAVHITLTAANEYLAIELFDHLVESAQGGHLRLEVGSDSGVLRD